MSVPICAAGYAGGRARDWWALGLPPSEFVPGGTRSATPPSWQTSRLGGHPDPEVSGNPSFAPVER